MDGRDFVGRSKRQFIVQAPALITPQPSRARPRPSPGRWSPISQAAAASSSCGTGISHAATRLPLAPCKAKLAVPQRVAAHPIHAPAARTPGRSSAAMHTHRTAPSPDQEPDRRASFANSSNRSRSASDSPRTPVAKSPGNVRAMLLNPSPRPPLDLRRQLRIDTAQTTPCRAQPRRIQRIDRECPMATLRASHPANQPIARAPRGFGQRRIHDLHQVPCRLPEAPCRQAYPKRSRPAPTAPSAHPNRAISTSRVHVIYLEHTPAPHRSTAASARSGTRARLHPAHRRERILPTGRVQVILNLARDFLLDCPEGQTRTPKLRPR